MENSEIKLSIIVPVYNVKDYLPQCMESLLAQTVRDYEIILVDDGSTDGSGRICDDYAAKYAQVLVLHKKNGGLSSARNHGMRSARGEYFGFIDSDDWVEANMYETLMAAAMSNSADVVCCGVVNYEDSTQKKDITRLKEQEICVYNGMAAKIELYKNFSACNKIYRASLFEGVEFPEGKLYEDGRTMYKIARKTETYVVCPYYGYYYRHRTSSIMGTFAEDRYLDRVNVWTEIYDGMKDLLPAEELEYILYRRDLLTIELLKSLMVKKRFFKNRELVKALAENLSFIGWKTDNIAMKDKVVVSVAKLM